MKKLARRLAEKITRRTSRGVRRSLRSLEDLESRVLLTVSPLLWANDGQISISFAPDGTDIAGQESKLFETFDAIESQAEWQTAVLRAFQTWSDHIAVDFGIVSDSGSPLGVSGSRTADDRFGDIRIGAIELASDVAAVSITDSAALSGTWTGDIVFNTNSNIQTIDNLYSVALHEVGHLLGLTHTESPSSVMHEHGRLDHIDLSEEDISEAINVNGKRLPDQYESPVSNDSIIDATLLSPIEKGFDAGATPIVVFADLHDENDVDVFKIESRIRTRSDRGRPEDYRGPMSIHLQTSEISLLSPSLTLVDRNGQELGLARSSSVGGATLSLLVDRIDPREEYYIQVKSSGTAPAFAIGSYSLTVSYDELLQTSIDEFSDIVTNPIRGLSQEQIHQLMLGRDYDSFPGENDSIPRAERLVARPEFEFNTYFQEYGTISNESASDFYRFSTPNLRENEAVMTTFVRSLDAGQLIPQVNIYDVQQNVVESRILANGGGELILQTELQANTNYFAEVTYADRLFAEGNYSINLSFGHESVPLDTFLATDVEIGTSVQSRLFIGQTQLFHFAFELQSEKIAEDYALMRILDQSDNTIHQIATRSGDVRSSSAVLMRPGTYRVVFDSFGASETASISLLGISLSDPFVVEPEDAIDETLQRTTSF